MPGCVLRVSGPHVHLVEALRDAFVPFVEARMTAKARECGKANETDESTFNFTVSDADGEHVPEQIRDAEAFVSGNLKQLVELRSRPGVERGVLDFGWEIPQDSVLPGSYFPSTLLSLCAEARLGIEVTVYLTDSETSNGEP